MLCKVWAIDDIEKNRVRRHGWDGILKELKEDIDMFGEKQK